MVKFVVFVSRYLFLQQHRINVLCRNNSRNLSMIEIKNKEIEACYRILGLPSDSGQEEVREAFLELAKKYHPDSGTPEANIDKFVSIENAFRVLTKHNTGTSSKNEVDRIVFDIRHTAPQHRQYLSYEGVGYGTPFQRQKQWQQARAQQAAENVMEHRLAKSVASEGTLMKKGQGYPKTHDIKTKYGFDRLVEDLIQESMSKGEFENLSGKGKPLRDQNLNPYVDFTTHKLNQVLINNGFTPEWITLFNEIEKEITALKEEIKNDRAKLGPYPLTNDEQSRWKNICELNRDLANSINMKINKYNLIVPLISKQKFHVQFDEICDDILKNGSHSLDILQQKYIEEKEKRKTTHQTVAEDIITVFFKLIGDLFSSSKKKKSEC